MIKISRPIYPILFIVLTSCLNEKTIITTDFDYVKLTETTKPLSPFYCKGIIRGMPFSYSTNDNFYADTVFPKASNPSANAPYVFFSIGNFNNYPPPILIYIESRGNSINDFLQNKLKINTDYAMTSEQFNVSLYVQYTNQYIGSARYFDCCSYDQNVGVMKIANIEHFKDYTAVTFQFSCKLYSSYTEGSRLYFGDASVEMRIRIDP